ncbi:MAG: flagellar hook-length control protein FliK [Planctomycetota bacterium]
MTPKLPTFPPNLPAPSLKAARSPLARPATDLSRSDAAGDAGSTPTFGDELRRAKGRGLARGHGDDHPGLALGHAKQAARRADARDDAAPAPETEDGRDATDGAATAPVDGTKPSDDAPLGEGTAPSADGAQPDAAETKPEAGADDAAASMNAGDAQTVSPDAGAVNTQPIATPVVPGLPTDSAADDAGADAIAPKADAGAVGASGADASLPTDLVAKPAAGTDAGVDAASADDAAQAAQPSSTNGATSASSAASTATASAAAAADAQDARDADADATSAANATSTSNTSRPIDPRDPLARLLASAQAAIRDAAARPATAADGRLADVEASIARDRARGAIERTGASVDAAAPFDALRATAPGQTVAATTFGATVSAAARAGNAAGGLAADLARTVDAGTPAPAQLAAKGVEVLANQRGGAITMRLEPPALGQLRIQMQVSQGAVVADFTAATPEARVLLEMNLGMLRERLESQGLSVERLSVHGPSRGHEAGAVPTAGSTGDARHDGTDARDRGDRGERTGTRQDAAGGESRGRRDGDPADSRQRAETRGAAGTRAFAGVLEREAMRRAG